MSSVIYKLINQDGKLIQQFSSEVEASIAAEYYFNATGYMPIIKTVKIVRSWIR